jgi:uncharacterized protein YkwD
MLRLPFHLPLALCLAACLAACGGRAADTVSSAGAAELTTAAAPCPDLPDATALLQALNAARREPRTCGSTAYPATTALVWDTRLLAAAQAHSLDMARQRDMSHTGSDGSTAGTRLTAAGYAWRAYGENIAAGQATAQAVLDDWLASEGHCANLMDARFRDVALACASNNGERYWTQVFGTTQ